jgi:hypothetical protein
LESSGKIREADLPSLRVLGDYQALWLLDYKVGLTDDFGKESSERWLEPGAEINRNELMFKGNFPYDGETREYDLKIVYYHSDTRTIQTENGTVTQEYANVTGVDRKTIQMSPGFQSQANISLRSHYDSGERMAIYLVDDNGVHVAKWGPYTHQSVQTTAGLPFSTWGGFLPWVIKWFLVTTGVGGAFAVVAGNRLARETGGFGKGLGWWAIIGGLAAGFAAYIYFAELVALIITIPFLLAVPVVFGIFVVTVEVMQPTSLARLEQPNITETESSVGEQRPHIEGERADKLHIFDRDDGLAFITYGSIRNALARWVAGLAVVPWDNVHKRYKVSGDSPDGEKFYIRGFDFEPAHWTFAFPELKTHVETEDGGYVERWRTGFIAGAVVSVLAGWALATGLFSAPYLGVGLGLLPSIASGLEPHRGEIDIEFADGAEISAKAARVTETEERIKYDSLDKAIEGISNAQEDVWKQIQHIVHKTQQERDNTIDELYEFSDGDVFDGPIETNGSSQTEVVADGGDE